MSLYDELVPTYLRMLACLDRWLEEAEGYANERGFEVDVLLRARLAPDQFTLVQQLRSACDTAKFGVSRVAGLTAPSHADDETTVAQVRARIADVRAWLEAVEPGLRAAAPQRREARQASVPRPRAGEGHRAPGRLTPRRPTSAKTPPAPPRAAETTWPCGFVLRGTR